MNTIEDIFSEYAERITDSAKEQKSTFIQYCKGISSLIPDSFYVLDIVQKQFIHIKPDNLFLCGHSVKEAMELGYDFFSRVIHPEDWLLWKSFLENLPQKLHRLREDTNERGEFFCLFRLSRKYPFLKEPVELHTYHRLIPICEDSNPIYLIDIISYTNCKKIGCYLNGYDHLIYQTYDPMKCDWQILPIPQLSKREMEILTIAKGEQDITTIADKLYISYHTARGHINSIKKKLQLQDLREATDWISYLHILQSPQEKYAKGTYCSTANPTFNKELNDIQALLDKKQCVRSIALATGRSESTIRSWIQKGFLKK